MSQFNVDNCVTTRGSRPHIGITRGCEDGVNPSERNPETNVRYRKDMDTNQHVGYTDLQTRPSYVNASLAYDAIKKGKADGNTCALWVRFHLQKQLFDLGCFIQKHSGKCLFVGLLLLSICCVSLRAANIETDIEKLWVQDGGRLQNELEYTRKTLGEGAGSSSELIIQTGKSVLTPEGLLLHYNAVRAATQVSVHLYDINWNLKDLCITAEFPKFESALGMLMENLLPCVIVTPLDCFWEGSKLLGPEDPLLFPAVSVDIKWSNLNPRHFLDELNTTQVGNEFELETISDMMQRAGVTTGYMEKPCLNPRDPDCPWTAPNKNHVKGPDVGAALAGGCHGFAARFMHWQEELIVGGTTKNKSGSIIEAEALMSIIQLMGEENLYEFWRDEGSKVYTLDWDVHKAANVLQTWQRAFTQEVERAIREKNTTGDKVYAFSSTSLADVLREFSSMNHALVNIGFVLMVIYACVTLLKWSDPIHSQCTIGIAGVLLIALSLAAGLGISSLVVDFNATTLQIIPFLALGLGVDDMFVLAFQFGEISSKNQIPYEEQTGECLKRAGVNVLLTSISIAFAFFLAAIIPIPALRAFAIQAAIVTVFNLATVLLVFPAVVSIDLWRRHEKRIDFFCCLEGGFNNMISSSASSSNNQHSQQPSSSNQQPFVSTTQSSRSVTSSANNNTTVIEIHPGAYCNPASSQSHSRGSTPPPPYSNNTVGQDPTKVQAVTMTTEEGSHPTTVLAPPQYDALPRAGDRSSVYSADGSLPASTASSQQCLTSSGHESLRQQCMAGRHEWLLPFFAKQVYGPQLEKTPFKIITLVLFTVLLICGIVGTVRVQDGLDVTDIVPKGTSEYSFLEAQSKYFGFYNFFAVTKDDFDYAGKQKLLFEYHNAFQKVDRIVKKEDGSLPHFWLSHMRNWLKDMQKAFDREKTAGCLHPAGWYRNATEQGILGYLLMVQTGDLDHPIDTTRFVHGRLVLEDETIYRNAFYNYLTAWSSNDALAYASSQPMLHPQPEEWIFESPHDIPRHIAKSHPLVYAQSSFYLNGMSDTQTIVETIKEVREICDHFAKKGLPNYPSGVPFTYYEQYLQLRMYLMLALFCVFIAIFLVLTFYLWNPWIAAVVVVVLGLMQVELFGFMGLAGVKLSAIPAVILIIAPGIGVEFTVHISLGFLTSIGSRTLRTRDSVEHFLAPVTHGAVSTFLGILMLAFSPFDFVFKYFFVVLSVLLLLGTLNGLLLLPVLLSMLGPRAEVRPADGTDILTPPTPEPTPKPERRRSPQRAARRIYPKVPKIPQRVPSNISLTTITEEPSQYSSSHEITVQPHVVVETTSHPASAHFYTSSSSSANSSPSDTPPPQRHVTRTKVKATATVKVEVHTPHPGAVDCDHYKSKRRKSREHRSHRAKESYSLEDMGSEATSQC